MKKRLISFLLLLLALAPGCSGGTAKHHYVLAEKLWSDKKYAAAVAEFEKVISKGPSQRLGKKALYRAATTETLFLERHPEALKKLREFIRLEPKSAEALDARRLVGEILFAKTEQYSQAIEYYTHLIQQAPEDDGVAGYWFRIAKSHFFLWQFDEATEIYTDIISRFPTSPWAEESSFQLAVTRFTQGDQIRPKTSGKEKSRTSPYQEAIDGFERFLLKHPQSRLAGEAHFGIASCLEEMDQLDAAVQKYREILPTYAAPGVIRAKLVRIEQRRSKRSR